MYNKFFLLTVVNDASSIDLDPFSPDHRSNQLVSL